MENSGAIFVLVIPHRRYVEAYPLGSNALWKSVPELHHKAAFTFSMMPLNFPGTPRGDGLEAGAYRVPDLAYELADHGLADGESFRQHPVTPFAGLISGDDPLP